MKRFGTRGLILSGALWFCATGLGLRALWRYEAAPGAQAPASQRWPAGSTLSRRAGRQTLVLFVHPKCPCSRSSLGELAVLLTRASSQPTVHVLFYRPEGSAESWSRTDLWDDAVRLPGVIASSDPGGAQAALFGAETSGELLLYDQRGLLIFNGGITKGRGHFGDNGGLWAVQALLDGAAAPAHRALVFGCSLHGRPLGAKGQVHS